MRTWPDAASPQIRWAMWTLTPRMSPPRISTSPVWIPARTLTLRCAASWRMASADWTARVGPSNTAMNPSPIVLISVPSNRAMCRRTMS